MILLTKKYGQMGNRLAYLRVFLAFALEHDVTIINLGFDEYGHYFNGTNARLVTPHRTLAIFTRCLLKLIRRLLEPLFELVTVITPNTNDLIELRDDKIIHLCCSTVVVIDDGWPVIDLHVLRKHDQQVRNYFTPVNKKAEKIHQFLIEARKGCDILIGIHIRQGDYRVWENGRHYFPSVKYADIMRRLVEIHANQRVRFMVATNEEQNWDIFSAYDYRRAPGGALEDMYALAGCDEIYGPQSSYSAWASFYGKVPLCWIDTPDCFDRASKIMD